MTSDEPTPDSANWLRALRRAIDNLVKINQNLERLRQENKTLRQQIIELARTVSYQAGQLQQIGQRIKDAVAAEVLRELTRHTRQPEERQRKITRRNPGNQDD
jgi:predicted RNase H-like nuclease (RuvC/YqgF family)